MREWTWKTTEAEDHFFKEQEEKGKEYQPY